MQPSHAPSAVLPEHFWRQGEDGRQDVSKRGARREAASASSSEGGRTSFRRLRVAVGNRAGEPRGRRARGDGKGSASAGRPAQHDPKQAQPTCSTGRQSRASGWARPCSCWTGRRRRRSAAGSSRLGLADRTGGRRGEERRRPSWAGGGRSSSFVRARGCECEGQRVVGYERRTDGQGLGVLQEGSASRVGVVQGWLLTFDPQRELVWLGRRAVTSTPNERSLPPDDAGDDGTHTTLSVLARPSCPVARPGCSLLVVLTFKRCAPAQASSRTGSSRTHPPSLPATTTPTTR